MSQTLFVNFQVYNYQGLPSLTGFALPQSRFLFVPTLTSAETLISSKKVLWDFGDGTTSTSITGEHYYEWPGEYNVSVIVYDVNGDAYISSVTPTISVIDFIPNQLIADTIDSIALDIPAGNIVPFQISRSNSWQTYRNLSGSNYTINLYVSGSLDPLADVERYNSFNWSHLLQQAYFYRKQVAGNTFEYVPVSSIATSTEKIYANLDDNNNFYICPDSVDGSFFVGTSGVATAYFTSNKPKHYTSVEAPLIIFCNLDTRELEDSFTNRIRYFDYNSQSLGYLNTAPAVLYAYSRYNPATNLSFSTNGITTQGDAILSTFEMPIISWQNTLIPFIARLENDQSFATAFYPLLSSNVQNLSTNAVLYNATISLLSAVSPPKKANALFYSEFLDTLPSDVGGYFKGYFISSNSIQNAYLSATVTIQDPEFYKLNTVNTVYANASGSVLFADQDIISSQGNTLNRHFQLTPYITKSTGGNTFAVVPSSVGGYKSNLIWGLSSDNIFTLDYKGDLVNLYNVLNTLNNTVTSAGPAAIAVDGSNNAWIALYTASSALKINESGSVQALACKSNLALNTTYPNNVYTQTLTAGNLVAPLHLDTDRQNNVWVSHYNPRYNYVIKYDSTGAYTTSIKLSADIIPDKIIADKFDNIWVIGYNLHSTVGIPIYDTFTTFTGEAIVTFAGNQLYSILPLNSDAPLSASGDYIFKLSSTATVLASAQGLQRPTSITYDLSGHIWVTHGTNILTKVDRNSLVYTNYYIGSAYTDKNTQALFALTCNTYNKLSVYNSADNSLYILDAQTPAQSAQYPLAMNYITDTGDDFNGYRWITKYAVVSSNTRTVTGLSNAFTINPDSGVYHITKQNENFDMAAYFNTLKLPEYLVDKTVMFSDFLGSIFGAVSSQPYELGKTLYERIANFGDNTSNVDTATVEALISLSEQTGTDLSNVVYEYPPQLRRIVDILSIKHSKLYGSANKFNESFSSQSGLTPYNLGASINTTTGTFSLSETLVILEKFSNQYKTIKMPALSTYPGSYQLALSAYTPNWGLPLVLPDGLSGSDIGLYYLFYRYKDAPLNNIMDSVINWSDPSVTLSPNNSSYSAWSYQDGIMDNIINYEMAKGLRLFTSAVDIVYNN